MERTETTEKKPPGKPIGLCKKCRNRKPIERDNICTGCKRRDKTKDPKDTDFQAVGINWSKRYYAKKTVVAAARAWRNDRSAASALRLVDAIDYLEALYKGTSV
jgi:hypothetical protein